MWVQGYGPCPKSQERLQYAVLLQKTFFTGSVGTMCTCCVNSVLQDSVSIHGTEHIVLVLEPPLPAPHRLSWKSRVTGSQLAGTVFVRLSGFQILKCGMAMKPETVRWGIWAQHDHPEILYDLSSQ